MQSRKRVMESTGSEQRLEKKGVDESCHVEYGMIRITHTHTHTHLIIIE